jgi:hypothetical protein
MNRDDFLAAIEQVRLETHPAFDALIQSGRLHLVTTTGLYPRVRVEREDDCHRFFEFWMTLDEAGRYRTTWDRRAPFELSGGAMTSREEDGDHVRYVQAYVLYKDRPYEEALLTLPSDVSKLADIVEAFSVESVVKDGRRGVVRTVPKV